MQADKAKAEKKVDPVEAELKKYSIITSNPWEPDVKCGSIPAVATRSAQQTSMLLTFQRQVARTAYGQPATRDGLAEERPKCLPHP